MRYSVQQKDIGTCCEPLALVQSSDVFLHFSEDPVRAHHLLRDLDPFPEDQTAQALPSDRCQQPADLYGTVIPAEQAQIRHDNIPVIDEDMHAATVDVVDVLIGTLLLDDEDGVPRLEYPVELVHSELIE